MSIFAKFGGSVTLLLLLATGGLGYYAIQSQQRNLTREAILRGQSIAVNLAYASAEPFLARDPLPLVGLCVDAAKNHPGVIYAALVDNDNRVLGHPDASQIGKAFSLEATQALDGFNARVAEADTNAGDPLWDISVPVKVKGSDKVLGSVHVGLSRASVEAAIQSDEKGLLTVAAGVMLLGLALSFGVVRLLVRPIQSLAAAAKSLGSGNLDTQVKVGSRDEIGRLAATFNSMAVNLKQGEKIKLEKERMESELNVARAIQDNLLPKQVPPLPGLSMAFTCKPAKELGGDFYDCFLSRDFKKMGFVMADVSGKGVPAALHMANLRNLMRFISQEEDSPREVLKRVDRLAYPDFKEESFVTLVYGMLDPSTHKLVLANAGHDPLLLKRAGSGELVELKPPGMPLGLVDPEDFDAVLGELSVDLGPGDLLLAYTDGVTEAMNTRREQFGMERLKAELAAMVGPQEMVSRMATAVAAHAGLAEQSDDITLLSIQVS